MNKKEDNEKETFKCDIPKSFEHLYDGTRPGKLLFVNAEELEKIEKILDEYAYLKIKVKKLNANIERLKNENLILKNGIMKINEIVTKKNKKRFM